MHKLDKIRNDKIRKRVRCTNAIVQLVFTRQHKWLGYVLRMDDERIAKIVLQGKMESTRRRGKLRTASMSAMEHRTGIKLHRKYVTFRQGADEEDYY